MADYEFKYSPLTGRLTGKQMIEQTEQAINGLASLVDDAAGQVEIISTLANEANENAATALETAEEALATTGRTYITVSIPADANDYYDSQLIYIADNTSTNIPVADTGMLEVKTNDNKTSCEQVFIADSSGEAYYRHGDITAETVGDVTTYTVTWGGWSSEPASQSYVQGELANYLPLSGGTLTGAITIDQSGTVPLTMQASSYNDIQVTDGSNKIGLIRIQKDTSNSVNSIMLGVIPYGTNNTPSGITVTRNNAGTVTMTGVTPEAGDNSTKLATTAFVNTKASGYLPLSGGTMTGEIKRNGNAIVCSANNGNISFLGGTDSTSPYISLYGKTHSSYAGRITLRTGDGTHNPALLLYPNGTFTWDGNNVLTDATVGSYLSKDLSGTVSLSASTAKTIISMSLPAGRWIVKGFVRYSSITASKLYGVQLANSGNSFSYSSGSGTTVHSSSTGNLSVQTVHVWIQSATANIYLCGYATAACTAENAIIQAVRIV